MDICRPILTDLAFYNRINLRLLRHLHRLLVRMSREREGMLGGWGSQSVATLAWESVLGLGRCKFNPHRVHVGAGLVIWSIQRHPGGQAFRASQEMD